MSSEPDAGAEQAQPSGDTRLHFFSLETTRR